MSPNEQVRKDRLTVHSVDKRRFDPDVPLLLGGAQRSARPCETKETHTNTQITQQATNNKENISMSAVGVTLYF